MDLVLGGATSKFTQQKDKKEHHPPQKVDWPAAKQL